MTESNPYVPPESGLERPAEAPSPERIASRGQRFANLLLDSVGYLVLSFFTGIVIAMVDPQLIDGVDDFVLGCIILALYYVPLETLLGRTPAKLLTGTRVVAAQGGPPGFGRVLGRTLIRMVPFEAISFLFGGGRPVGWHDAWSGTRVVSTRAARPPDA